MKRDNLFKALHSGGVIRNGSVLQVVLWLELSDINAEQKPLQSILCLNEPCRNAMIRIYLFHLGIEYHKNGIRIVLDV